MRSGAIGLLLITLLAPGCAFIRGQQEPVDEHQTPVTVAAVTIGSITNQSRVSGHTKPSAEVTITSRVSGRVLNVSADIGDRLEAGDTVVRIDDEDIAIHLRQARAALDMAKAQMNMVEQGLRTEELEAIKDQVAQAQTQYERAITAFGRATAMYESGAISTHEYEEAQTHLRMATAAYEEAEKRLSIAEQGASEHERQMARAQVAQAEAQVEAIRAQQRACTITAPVSGLVAAINVRTGEMVGAGTFIAHIVDIDAISISASVGEALINHVQRSDILTVEIPAANITSQAEVTTVAPAPDPQTRAYNVTLKLPNPEHSIKPGMYAAVTIVVDHRPDAMIMPLRALVEIDGKRAVFVIDGDRAYLTEVITGITDGESIEIKSGLSPGQLVIISGHHYVKDESRIKIVERR